MGKDIIADLNHIVFDGEKMKIDDVVIDRFTHFESELVFGHLERVVYKVKLELFATLEINEENHRYPWRYKVDKDENGEVASKAETR